MTTKHIRAPRSVAGPHQILRAIVVLGTLILTACSDSKDLPRNTQTVDGMRIELGVLPAGDVKGHPIDPKDPAAMHGGAAEYSGSHHLVVALFDAKTGERITNARILARVGERSYSHDTPLEPMEVNGLVTYGGFFRMPGSSTWRIHLVIERPGVAHVSNADFAYEHPPY